MTPYMQAYRAGARLAKLAHTTKLAKGMPDSLEDPEAEFYQHTIDRGIEDIQRARDSSLNRDGYYYQDRGYPAYIGDTRVETSPLSDNAFVRERGNLMRPDENYLELRSGGAPVGKRDFEAFQDADSQVLTDYINPIILGHEYAHSLGIGDETEADAFAAMQDYDMRDVADFYLSLADKDGNLPDTAPGYYTPYKDRVQLFARNGMNVAPLAPEVYDEGDYVSDDSEDFEDFEDFEQPRAGIQSSGNEQEPYTGPMSRYTSEGYSNPRYSPAVPSYIDMRPTPAILTEQPRNGMTRNRELTPAEQVNSGRYSPAVPSYIDMRPTPEILTEQPRNGMTRNRELTSAEQVNSGRYSPAVPSYTRNLQAPPSITDLTSSNIASMAREQAPSRASAEPMGPPSPINFKAVRGGYGRQLAAMRNMKGLSQQDRDYLNKANYRQLASAMQHKGLQVGDTFDMNAVLQRMRATGPSDMPALDIINSRGRQVTRGTKPPRRL